MIVYRVEHRAERIGPYYIPDLDALSFEENELRCRAVVDHADDEHPEPWEDGLDLMTPQEFCCFTSLEALCEWFGDDSLDLLDEAGYGVFPFEVEDAFVRQGRLQALFVRSASVRMAELEPALAG